MNKLRKKEWAYQVTTPKEWHNIMSALIRQNASIMIWCFEGNLGVGKTTSIQYLCKALQVQEKVTSPTFSLVNSYQTQSGNSIYHADLYRIKNQQELQEIGIDYYLESGSYFFIEWPEQVLSYILHPYLLFRISNLEQGRKVIVSLINPKQR
ncbi:MAG: tRNA (adenosine(37)-N6)-threonylcarbamoyltransferase complex ATPase subunit type 1 TsaE [Bacteroidota bacterium]